jgi:hypothetical protein
LPVREFLCSTAFCLGAKLISVQSAPSLIYPHPESGHSTLVRTQLTHLGSGLFIEFFEFIWDSLKFERFVFIYF